jgi:hypothetical protein
MENTEYRFERFSKEKIEDLRFLLNSPTQNLSHSFFEKKFNTAFTGISYVGFIAYHRSTHQPAAFYGVFPVFLEINGAPILAAQSGDTITHPAHQKKGLFISLAKLTYNLCIELKIQIVFGFPNQNSSPGFFRKLDWKQDGVIHRYAIPVPSGLMKKVLRKAIPSFYYRFRFRDFSGIVPLNSYSNDITIYKSKDYLNYKLYSEKYFFSNSEVSVSFKIQYDLHIGNIYFKKEVSPIRLHQILIHLSNITFTSKIILHFSEFMKEHSVLLENFRENDRFFENGRLDLFPGYEDKHLVFSFEDFDSF